MERGGDDEEDGRILIARLTDKVIRVKNASDLATWLRSATLTMRSEGRRPGTGGRRIVWKRALQKGQRDSTRAQAMMQTKQKWWAQQSSSPRIARRESVKQMPQGTPSGAKVTASASASSSILALPLDADDGGAQPSPAEEDMRRRAVGTSGGRRVGFGSSRMWLVGLGLLGRSFVPAKFLGARIWARDLNGREIWAEEAEFGSFPERERASAPTWEHQQFFKKKKLGSINDNVQTCG